jgi:hypothetical protein
VAKKYLFPTSSPASEAVSNIGKDSAKLVL